MSLLVWNQIRIEPIVREADSSDDSPTLIVDIGIHGVWLPQVEWLTLTPNPTAIIYQGEVLNSAESEKRRKYVRSGKLPLCAFLLMVCGEEKLSD